MTKESIFNDFLKNCGIKDLELASTLDSSKLSNIDEWISTGSYALNKVLSGSYYKGIPRGRIISLGGPSGVGKSYICGCCMREAQKMGYKVIVFDSENALDKEFLSRIGVDVYDLLHIPVMTVTDVKLKGIHIMRKFNEMYPNEKMFIVIDSIGNLSTEKEFNGDIEAGRDAADMGLRAKQLRVLAKVFTHEVAKTKAAMMVTNHTYEKPNPYNPALPSTTTMNGGEGFVYSTSAIIFLKKFLEKEEEKDLATKKTKKVITGARLVAHTEKNRFVPQGAEAEIFLSFEKGMNKWYGLLGDAMEHGFVEQGGAWYTVKNAAGEVINKIQSQKKLYTKDVWLPILDELNTKIENSFKFATHSEDEIEEIDNIIESKDE